MLITVLIVTTKLSSAKRERASGLHYVVIIIEVRERERERQTDRQTDRRTDGRTDGRTDRRTLLILNISSQWFIKAKKQTNKQKHTNTHTQVLASKITPDLEIQQTQPGQRSQLNSANQFPVQDGFWRSGTPIIICPPTLNSEVFTALPLNAVLATFHSVSKSSKVLSNKQTAVIIFHSLTANHKHYEASLSGRIQKCLLKKVQR